MKSSSSELKPFQSRSKGEISGRARRKERLSRSKLKQEFLIDSDAELFMYLIQCIRFGSWKVRRLNRAKSWLSMKHWSKNKENTYNQKFTCLRLLGITPLPSSSPRAFSRLACHHSSSLALVTWRISPYLKLSPWLGRPLSFVLS